MFWANTAVQNFETACLAHLTARHYLLYVVFKLGVPPRAWLLVTGVHAHSCTHDPASQDTSLAAQNIITACVDLRVDKCNTQLHVNKLMSKHWTG